jgi:hypothetical protein
MRTREVTETNRYPFRPNAERDRAIARRELDSRRQRSRDRLRSCPLRDSGPTPQLDELRTAGCDPVREEHASGIRPVLTGLPRDIRADETADGQIAAIACARGTALLATCDLGEADLPGRVGVELAGRWLR